MRTFAVILGGGVGNRMDSLIPKQFIPLAGKPVIMHTIEKFRSYNAKIEIILVLPEAHIQLWKDMCNEFQFGVEHQIVRGGKERFYSVKNAITHLPDDSIVLIHDGVRPLVSHETIDRVQERAIEKGNAIPYVDINESIRRITKEGNKAVKRDGFKIIQTPQAFNTRDIKAAYSARYRKSFTDDASVFEAKGHKIELVLGNQRNIKITRPIDLVIAESLL
jgi:2-C-methyl-D-erythritol 4-phosphate cytidylyltransferase